jgi:putative transposase
MIRAIHAEFKGAYGSPRIVRELRQRGYTASKERVERLMREHGICARHKRRYRVTTDSKHSLPIAPNLLDRNFAPAAPNLVWTDDSGSGDRSAVDGMVPQATRACRAASHRQGQPVRQ